MRVLIAAHGHPRFSSGGGENAAFALFKALLSLPGVDCRFLASVDDDLIPISCDIFGLTEKEWVIRRSSCNFFCVTSIPVGSDSDFSSAVQEFNPDVVHLHHFFGLGFELIHALRQCCPQARLILTLHEFLALCPYNGQLLKRDGRLCDGPKVLDCMQCLVERSADDFVVRDQLVLATLRLFDVLTAPSQYLINRWKSSWLGCDDHVTGLPHPVLIENLLRVRSRCQDSATPSLRKMPSVFAYFGNLIPSKGVDLVLDAWIRFSSVNSSAHLIIYGAMPQYLDGSEFAGLVQRQLKLLGGRVTMAGRYDQSRVLELMANVDWVVMASRWPENSPVVIEEAKAARRPLLVPGFGGMAEKVMDDRDGLHYLPHSSFSLSELMLRCCSEEGLWTRLHSSMAKPASSADVLNAYLAVYRCANSGLER